MKRRLCTISLTTALVLAACSGGETAEQAQAPAETATIPRSVGNAGVVETTTTTTASPATTTTIAPLAPSTLAFASADDVGRVFTIDLDIAAATSPGGEPDAGIIAVDTVVQTSSVRSVDGNLWVRLESTGGESSTLGWLPADVLSPATEPVLTQDASVTRQLRQVSSLVENGSLGVFSNPGVGTPVRSIPEAGFALHGGVSALVPNGDTWLDIVDPDSGERVGWVEARSFSRVSGGQLQDEGGNSLGRSPIDGVSYGQSLTGEITTSACNAVQVTFANSSSVAGIGVVFGTTSPLGRELNSGRFDWSGTSAFGPAGSDIVITIPTSSEQTWFFAPLDNDGNADFSTRDADGFAIATGVLEVPVPASGCVPPPTSLVDAEDGDLAYIEDLLTESEREEALASLAEIQAEADVATDEEAAEEDAQDGAGLADDDAIDPTSPDPAEDASVPPEE